MGSGRLPTPTGSWAASPWVSLAPGPDLEGSRTVAASTPIRISVSLDRGPQATRHGMGGCDWRTSELKHEPEEIPDAEHELVIERVAAVDVAKASGKVCVRVPGKAGRRVSRVWDVAATTAAVTELAEDLVEVGLEVQLVNARDVKNVPGRAKTDKLDAVWLAKLTEKGLLRPSFVPPTEIRRLRDYTRLREDLTHDRSRQVQRLEKLLEDALVKLSTVATDIIGVSGRAMIEALIAGQRDAKVLA